MLFGIGSPGMPSAVAGGPQALQLAYLRDPRLALAAQLAKQGSDTSPVQSPLQGVARVAQGLLSGIQSNRVRGEYEKQAQQYQDDMRALYAPVQELQAGQSGTGPRPDAQMGTRQPTLQEITGRIPNLQSPYALQEARRFQEMAMQQAAAEAAKRADPMFGRTAVRGVGLVDMRGGQPQVLIPEQRQNTPKMGDVRRIPMGDLEVAQEWDGQKWTEIGKGPRWQPQQPDRTLVAIPDEKSPTGFKYVPRDQAVNQPAMGPQGVTMDIDPATGRPRMISVGPSRGNQTGAGIGQPAANRLEEDAINAANQISRLDSIRASFRPEYLEIMPRVGATWQAIREKSGAQLTPEQRQQLTGFTAFRRETVANLNQTIKDITGAAMTEAEAARLSQQVPVAGTGIFDGDSPTEFQAKLNGATTAARNALLRANYARANGLNPLQTGISLERVPQIVEQRGAQIEQMVRNEMQGADDVAVLTEVRKRLAREFGMAR